MSWALLIDPDNWDMRYNFACSLSAYPKDREAALDMLKPLFETMTGPLLRYAKADPDLECLHDDPRYQARSPLLKRALQRRSLPQRRKACNARKREHPRLIWIAPTNGPETDCPHCWPLD